MLAATAACGQDGEIRYERSSLTIVTRSRAIKFDVEMALTEPQREHGLMFRKKLGPYEGMLFDFYHEQKVSFWMKNTLIPLDILYFDGERKLVSAQVDVQPCKADPCPVYPSAGPARYVLELSAGTAARIGVRNGDTLAIEGRLGTVD